MKGKSNPAYKHGHAGKKAKDPLYNRWRGMMERCGNPNSIGYKDYGARGIFVCEKWKQFDGFLEDMGPTFKPTLLLERVDNDGPYCKSNCVWATRTQQNRNSRHNTIIEAFGKRQPVSVWADEYGINQNTFLGRIRMGWKPEKILTTPVDHRRGAYQVKKK